MLDHWRRKTIDARPRRSVLESDHRAGSISLSCALAVDLLTPRRAHLFCFSALSLRAPYYHHPCQLNDAFQTGNVLSLKIKDLQIEDL
jgi:hypothetical protein